MKRTPIRKVAQRRGGAAMRDRAACDDLARTVVMLRAGASRMPTLAGATGWFGSCQWCGHKRWLQWCHIHARSTAPSLRWEPDNAFAACAGCHLFKWHKDPGMAEEFIVGLMGSERREALRLRSKMRSKVDVAATRAWLELEVARMERRER